MDFFLPGDTPNVNWYNTNLSLFVSSQFKMLASFEWNLFSIFTFCTLHTKNNFFRSFRLKSYFITESIHLICKRYTSNILLVLHLKQFYLCLWHYNSFLPKRASMSPSHFLTCIRLIKEAIVHSSFYFTEVSLNIYFPYISLSNSRRHSANAEVIADVKSKIIVLLIFSATSKVQNK